LQGRVETTGQSGQGDGRKPAFRPPNGEFVNFPSNIGPRKGQGWFGPVASVKEAPRPPFSNTRLSPGTPSRSSSPPSSRCRSRTSACRSGSRAAIKRPEPPGHAKGRRESSKG
jgi:hypothetical protein